MFFHQMGKIDFKVTSQETVSSLDVNKEFKKENLLMVEQSYLDNNKSLVFRTEDLHCFPVITSLGKEPWCSEGVCGKSVHRELI